MASESPALPKADIKCAQCGGLLQPDQGQLFLTCPYCGSAVYLDKSKVVFHWSLASTLSPEAAAANLRRWMAGNQTVKDLDQKSQVLSQEFQYFPVWYCKARVKAGKEEAFIEPAAATSVSEIKSLVIPAGDLQKYDPALDYQAVMPTVPLPAMLTWLAQRGVASNQVLEAALVHLPVYIIKYQFAGRTYTAMVEGATGKVFANVFPAKAEAPYQAVAALSVAGFMCISAMPLAGWLVNDVDGAAIGFVACLGGGAVFAVVIFALAAVVSAKV